MIKYAANYFDLDTFPNGEAKRILQRVGNKKPPKRTVPTKVPAKVPARVPAKRAAPDETSEVPNKHLKTAP